MRYWVLGSAALVIAAMALWFFDAFAVRQSPVLLPEAGGPPEQGYVPLPLEIVPSQSNQPNRAAGPSIADAPSAPDVVVNEQLWMAEHGYPATDEWGTLARLDVAELERQVVSGSIAAATVLGYKLGLHGCDEGVRDVGERLLLEATANGSSFAPQLLAEVRVAHRTDEWFAALGAGTALMHAYLLGDHAATGALQDALPGGMVSEVTAIALMEWQQMQEARVLRGLPPLVNHPRPRGGVEAAYEFEAAAPLDGACYQSAAFD
jgi:hypothetical protein